MSERYYHNNSMRQMDHGPNPYVADFETIAKENSNYLATVWTGNNIQSGVVNLPPNTQTGARVEQDLDQIIRVTDGIGWVAFGNSRDKLAVENRVRRDMIIMIPAGTWYNITNKEEAEPLKMFAAYGPPKYAHGTVVPQPKKTPLQRQIDQGPKPYITDINKAGRENTNYLATLWTGKNLQLSLMSVPVGGEVALRVNQAKDEYIGPEVGVGKILMGPSKDNLTTQQFLSTSSRVMVPAGTWYKVVNEADHPLKLVFITASPGYPHGTYQPTPPGS